MQIRKLKFTVPAVLILLVAVSSAFSQTTYPMRIEDVKTLDEEGRVKTTFRRGDLVLVQAKVVCPFEHYAPPEYRFLYIVKYVDSRGVTFYYGVVYGVLQPGRNATYVVGGKIPENAVTGAYRAHIYVWSNWPAYQLPTAYARDVAVDFTVAD